MFSPTVFVFVRQLKYPVADVVDSFHIRIIMPFNFGDDLEKKKHDYVNILANISMILDENCENVHSFLQINLFYDFSKRWWRCRDGPCFPSNIS